MTIIDNFSVIRSHLTFISDYDRYIIHIIKRAKDDDGKKYGVNETNRLLKTFYITSLEYFDNKIPVIKDLCENNNARAYILPQVRNNEDCLKELLKIVVDNLSNPTIKPNHLVKKAFCGYHGSRDKKWILDLDDDNMTEYGYITGFPHDSVTKKTWTCDEVLEFVQNQLVEIGKSKDDAYMIPTRHGRCIITSPFNLQKAYEKCKMMFQGEHSTIVSYAKRDVTKSVPEYKIVPCKTNINGWIIKDGMALLYYTDFKGE